MTYEANVELSASEFAEINRLLDIEDFTLESDGTRDELGVEEDSVSPVYTAYFENGTSITQYLYSGQHNYWTEPDIKVAGSDGLDCDDNVGFCLERTEEFQVGDDLYAIHINLLENDAKTQKISKDLIYIISPYAGDVEANVAFAIRCCRMAIQQGYTPIAVHLLYPQILNGQSPEERATGLQLGLNVLLHCSAAWVCGTKISSGMAGEIRAAKRLNIPIRYMEEIK